jgi:hypothetical protein
MFNARIVIVPTDSTAVERLEWDSASQTLYTKYVTGDSVYADTEGGDSQFDLLRNLARQYGSWGSALHNWKQQREAAFEIRDRNAFDEFTEKVHPATMARIAEWAKEAVLEQQLQAQIAQATKQR